MAANTGIAVSWESKHRLEVIVAEMTAERAWRHERGRKVTMDDAVTRTLDRAERVDAAIDFIDLIMENEDDGGTLEEIRDILSGETVVITFPDPATDPEEADDDN